MKIIHSSRIRHYVKRLSIFLVTVALMIGIASCDGGASCGCSPVEWYLGTSSGEGGQVVVSGGPRFAHGTVVTIEAVADECYEFVNWTGANVSDPYSAITTITMDQAQNVTANFALLSYDLTVDSTDGGQVTSPGEDTFPYDCGMLVALVATPAGGYRFVNWTGNVGTIENATAASTTITMSGNYSITATFEQIPPEQFTLTISSTAGGSVTTPGEGTRTYDVGTVVDLVATPAGGYRFVNWTGNVGTIENVTAASTTITMQGNYPIAANFIAQYDLTIDSTDGGEVTTPGEGTRTYDVGTVVALVATPAGGYRFVNWTGNVGSIANANAAETIITVNGDYAIAANFEQIPPDQFTLTISSTAGGSVTIPGEGTCTYEAGTVVDLEATPASGYRFVNWTGNVGTIANVSAASTNIIMNSNYCITANFIIVQHDLTIDSTNGGEVITPGEGTRTYEAGTVVDLLAEAEAGYQFVDWTGDVDTIANVYAASTTITINGSYSILANFEEITGEQIWDWYDLDAIRNNLAGSYILMDDLDSNTAGYEELASVTANRGKGWQPIGTTAENDKFVGNFNGQGYVICDLFIDRFDEFGVGLFGVVGEGGVIESVGVVNGKVTGHDDVGGLVGKNEGTVGDCYSTCRVIGNNNAGGLVGDNSGNVSNCYCTGRVIGGSSVGGLLGHSSGNVSDSSCLGIVTGARSVGGLVGQNEGTASNCFSSASVTGNNYVGGLVGQNGGTARNCTATGSVTGNNYIGGLMGQNGGTASNCSATGGVTGNNHIGGLVGTNEGTVSKSYSTGGATGNTRVGGLVGQNSNAVSDSYSTGRVTGNDWVGGLVGTNEGTVSDSYCTGSATGNTRVGGLAGQNSNAVSDSYATGRVTGNKHVGGLVGRNEGAVSNSFWDIQTSGRGSSAGGTGRTTAQMKDFTTFSVGGWDIITVADSNTRNTGYIWNIVDDVTYPFLSWQP